MIAIVLITLRPDPVGLDFFRSLKREGYDLFVVVDDNTIHPVSDDTISYIQYNNQDCIRNGFSQANYVIKRIGPTGWDKAIRYFCTNTVYDHVWFIEDDILIPSPNTIKEIDTKYGSAGILSASNELNTTGRLDWHWRQTRGKFHLPWAKSMVCAVRLSRVLLEGVMAYVKKNKSLNFIEFLFHTIAGHMGQDVQVVAELDSIVWRHDWSQTEIDPTKLYHPVKGTAMQVALRSKLKMMEAS